jgi:hypothetical protein
LGRFLGMGKYLDKGNHMGWYETLKDLFTIANRLRDAELLQKLVEVQMEGAKIAQENVRLRQVLTDLHRKMKTDQEIHYRDDVYWRKLEDGKEEDPFCPKCFHRDDKTPRMTDRPGEKNWQCPVCTYVIWKPGHDPGPTVSR